MSFEKTDYTIRLWDRLFGFEHSMVGIKDGKYLERWIVYFGLGTLRLHKFYRGDDDRASHTHPWWFITFPLRPYRERVYSKGRHVETRVVEAWRPHFRPANFEHIVIDSVRVEQHPLLSRGAWTHDPRPFYTIVLTGHRVNAWGFYPKPEQFIYWRNYR